MSYDIHLFARVPGEAPLDTAMRGEIDQDRPLSAQAKARNARVAAALRAIEPGIEVHEAENWVEINWQADDAALQVRLREDDGEVTVPYWPGNQTAAGERRIAAFLLAACRETSFLAFDPQTEKMLDAETSPGVSPLMFDIGIKTLDATSEKRPWWKFW